MSYCAMSDVQTINPKWTYDESTTPTEAQVEEMIDFVAGEIDTILTGRGYTVPVTAPAELVTRLQLLNAQGAAGMANAAMFPQAEENPPWTQYQAGLKSLRNDDLPSAEGSPDVSLPSSLYTSGDYSGEYPTPKFSMAEEF